MLLACCRNSREARAAGVRGAECKVNSENLEEAV